MRKNFPGFSKMRIEMGIIGALGILIAIVILIQFNNPPTWYGYVVGEDRRIYMVNLETGQLEWISHVLQQIGEPTEIEIHREESILYITSGSALPRYDYIPLIAIKLNSAADLIFETPRFNDSGVADGAYSLRLNPNGKSLYVNYLYSDQFTTTLDPLTGKIIGSVRRPVLKGREFSQDGRMIANVVPGGTRVRENRGQEEYPGLIGVLDLETEEGSNTFLENNKALYPPWGYSEKYFSFVRFQPRQGIYRVEVYDRESGKVLATYDEFSEEVKLAPNQQYVTGIPGSENVVMTAGNEIIVLNGRTAEVVKRIYVVDDIRLTEVVVTDEPLIQAD